MLLLSYALQLTGLSCLALAMSRHRRQSVVSIRPVALRAGGVVALCLSLILCCTIWNPARAVPTAIGLASLAAISVALILSFTPRSLPRVAFGAPLAAMLVGLL